MSSYLPSIPSIPFLTNLSSITNLSGGVGVGVGVGLGLGLTYKSRNYLCQVVCEAGSTVVDTYVDLMWALRSEPTESTVQTESELDFQILTRYDTGYQEYTYQGVHYVGKNPSIPRVGETPLLEFVESVVIVTGDGNVPDRSIRERIAAAFPIMAGPMYDFCGENPTLEYLYAVDGGLLELNLVKVIYNTDLCNEYILT